MIDDAEHEYAVDSSFKNIKNTRILWNIATTTTLEIGISNDMHITLICTDFLDRSHAL